MSAWEAPGHGEWADSVAVYALGALPEAEAPAFEAHLAECAACRAELGELAPAVAALPASVPPRTPPPALRDRVLADVRREAELLHAAGPEADRPAPAPRARARRRRWLVPRWTVPALAAAALAVGFAVGELAHGGPASRTVRLAATDGARGADVRLTIADGHATLAADHLPAPPRGRVYMVWLKPPGRPPQATSALFVPRSDGTAVVAVPPAAAGTGQVMINTEPPGGTAQPTTAPVLTAKLGA